MAETTEIVTTSNEGNASVQTAAAWSTLKADTYESKRTIANMLNAASSLAGHEGETFTLKEVFFKPGIRRGRNGQQDTDCTDTYLLTSDGEVLFSKSDGVSRSVRNILMLLPDLNAPDGVEVKLDVIKLGNGNSFKQLIIV